LTYLIDGEPIPVEVRLQRIAALIEAARSEGLAALVIFSHGARSGIGTHGNLRYLLDFTSGGPPAVMVLPLDAEPAVGVTAPYDPPWIRELCPFIDDVRLENPTHQARLVRSILSQRGISGRVGLIGAGVLDQAVHAELTAVGSEWTFEPADLLLHRQRVRKDGYALARLRRAAAICDTMFAELADGLRSPGLPVWKAQALLNGVAFAEGAETSANWIVAGVQPDRTRGRREENMASIRPGERIVASMTITYAGHYGHTLRTYCIGEPSREHLRAWRAVAEAQAAAAACLRPGQNARLVPLAAEKVLFQHFPDAREGDRLRFQPTHFIGLDYAEYPTAVTSRPPSHGRTFVDRSPLSDYPLELDMTIELHPNVCPPGIGLAAVGDIFVVGAEGGQRLTNYPIELQVVTPR
jgi:Xaa-Pro aminopeptidase